MLPLDGDEYAESVYARLWHSDDTPPIREYPHSIFTVGVGALPETAHLVFVHITCGKARFEFRLTPENARSIGQHFLRSAAQAGDAWST